jgi:hypothetical protein
MLKEHNSKFPWNISNHYHFIGTTTKDSTQYEVARCVKHSSVWSANTPVWHYGILCWFRQHSLRGCLSRPWKLQDLNNKNPHITAYVNQSGPAVLQSNTHALTINFIQYCQMLWPLNLLLFSKSTLNPLNAELNPLYHLLALLGAHRILHVSRIRVKSCQANIQAVFLFLPCSDVCLPHPLSQKSCITCWYAYFHIIHNKW